MYQLKAFLLLQNFAIKQHLINRLTVLTGFLCTITGDSGINNSPFTNFTNHHFSPCQLPLKTSTLNVQDCLEAIAQLSGKLHPQLDPILDHYIRATAHSRCLLNLQTSMLVSPPSQSHSYDSSLQCRNFLLPLQVKPAFY